MDVAGTLEKAADRMERLGWRRDEAGRRNGPVCCEGALWWTIVEEMERQDAGYAELHRSVTPASRGLLVRAQAYLVQAIRGGLDLLTGRDLDDQFVMDMILAETGPVIVHWNDGECPDQPTAVDMLRRAAKEAANAAREK